MRSRQSNGMFGALLGAITIFFVFAGMSDAASASNRSAGVLHSTDAAPMTLIDDAPTLSCAALCIDQAEGEKLADQAAKLCGGSAKCSFDCDDGKLKSVKCDCVE